MTPRQIAADDAAATLTLKRSDFDLLVLRQKKLLVMLPLGEASISGDPTALASFFGALDQPEFWFNTATP